MKNGVVHLYSPWQSEIEQYKKLISTVAATRIEVENKERKLHFKKNK